MLVRLEIVGFKSFAEKTVLEFSRGMTAIVGPNGSGKSNLVDAIRWILGEQSPRSLRGGEMTDVIFHGSARRKSLGLAEVTLMLDNRQRLLAVETEEVRLTRRVYRDGSSEYLLNGQPARLRDFKEMFRDAGAAAHRMVVIAQGKVGEVLQASPLQRREMFEEAAGIGKYKSQEQDALRRLTATEENLQQVRHRLQQLESQLRNLKLQASQLQKYQELTSKIQERRLSIGCYELARLDDAIGRLRQQWEQEHRQWGEVQQLISKLEQYLHAGQHDRLATQQHDCEAELARIKQSLAASLATLQHQHRTVAEMDDELGRLASRYAELVRRWHQAHHHHQLAEQLSQHVDREWQQAEVTCQTLTATLSQLQHEAADLQAVLEQAREQLLERVRAAAAAQSAAHSAHSLYQRLRLELEGRRRNAQQYDQQQDQLAAEYRRMLDEQSTLQQTQLRHQEELDASQEQLAAWDRQLLQSRQRHEALRLQRSDVQGRLNILEDLEQGLDGLESGVRQVLQLWQQHPEADAPWNEVFGMVADLLVVPSEWVELVEILLGDTIQYFVIRRDGRLHQSIDEWSQQWRGLVGFVPWPPREPLTVPPVPSARLAVHVGSSLPELNEYLLGNVLLADDWTTARRWHLSYPGFRIVSRSGIILEPDGRVITGLRRRGGIMFRKTELRLVRQQLAQIDQQLQQSTHELQRLEVQRHAAAARHQELVARWEALREEAELLERKIENCRQTIEQWNERKRLADLEQAGREDEFRHMQRQWEEAQRQAAAAEEAVRECQRRIAATEQAIQENAAAQHRLDHQLRDAARQRDHLAVRWQEARQQFATAQAEWHQSTVELQELRQLIRQWQQRRTAAILAVLATTSQCAQLFANKQDTEVQLRELLERQLAQTRQDYARRQQLDQLRCVAELLRERCRELEWQLHTHLQQREQLLNRYLEEYGIDLAAAAKDMPIPADPAIMQSELHSLQRQLARIGPVQPETLAELQSVEQEHRHVHGQYRDLQESCRHLREIMDRLRGECERLFVATLKEVRRHFQELFRKLFGGGQAEIVLENEQMPLQGGIDIVVRPPGKEPRTLSLLSGGEKALTAIALLLALFRARPSPFCLLDEVDAPLDEANTTRLAALLREFASDTQFIVVTHQKRMMAAADVLWGVTMSEEGISRVLPLRFAEWSPQGAVAA